MRVEITKIARQSLDDNVSFLRKIWSDKEVIYFLNDVKKVIKSLENGEYLIYQKSHAGTRSALIGKNHVRMFFRKEMNQINVLLFFDMRQNPEKIFGLLT